MSTIRTVNRFAAVADLLKVSVTNDEKADITATDFKLGLGPRHGDEPAAFTAPDFDDAPLPYQRIVGHMVTASVAVGEYDLWLDVDDGNTHVRLRVGSVNVVGIEP